jgi:SET domain-containing protein
MLLVKAKIGPSTIQGIGLFADQFISKGTRVWEFNSDLDLEITSKKLNSLPLIAKASLLKYAYLRRSSGTYILCFDDARFFNHSPTPNTRSINTRYGLVNPDIALRDIEAGEELTTDFTQFDAAAHFKLRNTKNPRTNQ